MGGKNSGFGRTFKLIGMRTVGEINRNFKIKINGRNFRGRYVSKLVGVKGLNELVGPELAVKLIDRAFREKKQVIECKLRRGLIVRFYSH